MTAYRSRRPGDLRRALTFGGRMPAALGLLLALILAATVGSWVLRTSGWAVLSPDALLRGELWRLVSWAFVQDQPLTLLFGGFMLYSFGVQLVYGWSEGRLLWTFLGLATGASLVTVLLAALLPGAHAYLNHLGMWPVVNALMLMWALRNPDQQLNFWGVLPLTGRTMALLLVFGTVLYGIFTGGLLGLLTFTPHFAALGIGWALSRGRLPTQRWRLQWREWRTERQFRRRARHLKVIRKDGREEPPRWMN